MWVFLRARACGVAQRSSAGATVNIKILGLRGAAHSWHGRPRRRRRGDAVRRGNPERCAAELLAVGTGLRVEDTSLVPVVGAKWSLVCHAASSLLWACVFAAASVALESRRHRSGRSQRGVVTTAPRHRRETARYHRCTAGCQKLQPWRTRRHRNNPKSVPRNHRPRRNAPTSPRSIVCKPPRAAL